MYNPGVANAVRSGQVDQMIERGLRNGVDPLTGIINGEGPGGAGPTNRAARAIMNGTLSPGNAACNAMGGVRMPGLC
jgi:hypothetical protein